MSHRERDRYTDNYVDSRNEISGSAVQSRGHDRSLVSALNVDYGHPRRLARSRLTCSGVARAGKNAAALVAVLAAQEEDGEEWGERGPARGPARNAFRGTEGPCRVTNCNRG